MNSKGQSLVLFVLIIPIVLLLVLAVYDIGSMVLLKNELNDINRLVLYYGIDYVDDEDIYDKLTELISKNKSNIDGIDISVDDNKIYIVLEDRIDNKLSLINKIDVFKVKSSYVGYMEDGRKVIRKE